MSSADHEIALRHNLATVRRGFEPNAVIEAITRLEAEAGLLQADRHQAITHGNRLEAQLAEANGEIERLRREVTRLGKAPVTSNDMSERLRSMLLLADQEAEETRSAAVEDATATRNEADDYAWRARTEADEIVRQARLQAEQIAGERGRILDSARREASRTVASAEHDIQARDLAAAQTRDRLDAEAQHRRESEDEDYRIASDARRVATSAEIESERLAAAEAARSARDAATTDAREWRAAAEDDARRWRVEAESEAAETRASARADADELVAAAYERVGELGSVRKSMLSDIARARSVLESFELDRRRYDGDLTLLSRRLPAPWDGPTGRHADAESRAGARPGSASDASVGVGADVPGGGRRRDTGAGTVSGEGSAADGPSSTSGRSRRDRDTWSSGVSSSGGSHSA